MTAPEILARALCCPSGECSVERGIEAGTYSADRLCEARLMGAAVSRTVDALGAAGFAIVPRSLTPEMVAAGDSAADAATSVGRRVCQPYAESAIAAGALKAVGGD